MAIDMTKYTTMPRWMNVIIDAILPPKNDVEAARSLSDEELASLFSPRLAHEPWLLALFPYREAKIRALVRSIKFYGETTPLVRVAEVSAGFIAELISDRRQMSGWDTPLPIPIPSSQKRLRTRGYNQVERIAEAFLPTLAGAILYEPGALSREDRKSQVRVKRNERTDNIYGAFSVTEPAKVFGKQVVLLDDVVESGSTMKDARRALLAAGASDVLGIAITH